jgi:hypothetical protein
VRTGRPNRWMILQVLGVDVLACILFVILLVRQMYGYAALAFLGAAALTALIALGVSRGWFGRDPRT